jgi:hypothetical protein
VPRFTYERIDCKTRKVILAVNLPNVPYVAFSYTWEQNPGHDLPYSDSLPDDLPLTIEDSVLVTQKIGYRFLWIDRYCINQQMALKSEHQIRRMDLIYQNAQVTIVACASDDLSHGLPGVSTRKRIPQAKARVGGYAMVPVRNP